MKGGGRRYIDMEDEEGKKRGIWRKNSQIRSEGRKEGKRERAMKEKKDGWEEEGN